MRDRGTLIAVLVAVLVFAFVLVLGLLKLPIKGAVVSDRLGPDQGETVPAYLDRARATLTGPDERRYALVSFARGETSERAADVADGVRVSQVIHHVALQSVQTPIVVTDVPEGRSAVVDSSAYAATKVQSDVLVHDSRQSQVADVSSKRFAARCACVIALTVRATTSQLVTLAGRPGVRAVEALPPDAVWGRFAVAPLLPEQLDVVGPGADDGPVPDN